MPNWIQVRVQVKNPKVLTEKLLSEYTEEQLEKEENITDGGEELEKYVDFNKFIPTPADMEITVSSNSYKDESSYYNFQSAKVMTQKEYITPVLEQTYKPSLTQKAYVYLTLPRVMSNPSLVEKFKELYIIKREDQKEIEEEIANVLKGFYNLKKYGATDWYDFHIKNWGTKWNARTSYVDEERGFVEFMTAWGCPHRILEELAKYTDIAVSYVDLDDMGANYGVYTIVDGEYNPVIENRAWEDLDNTGKIQAISTATAMTMGEVYDINECIFDTEEVAEEYGMTKEEVMAVAQQAVDDTQRTVHSLNLD